MKFIVYSFQFIKCYEFHLFKTQNTYVCYELVTEAKFLQQLKNDPLLLQHRQVLYL